MNLAIYTRQGCHLCEDALLIVEELKKEWDFTYFVLDIGQSDTLTEEYGLKIPVIELDGKELAFGLVKKDFLSKRIQERIRIECEPGPC
ncbi:glutaredoxin family protein [Bacillus mangrovi]|uniref:Glutaredoxin family protein n=1 Tax=Metabacillus mangrovi TaxID=1491830 RepID=A0A7X2S6Q5_9BACI|nr:glutaredoxin family protein [Metabacillus mangrovi]